MSKYSYILSKNYNSLNNANNKTYGTQIFKSVNLTQLEHCKIIKNVKHLCKYCVICLNYNRIEYRIVQNFYKIPKDAVNKKMLRTTGKIFVWKFKILDLKQIGNCNKIRNEDQYIFTNCIYNYGSTICKKKQINCSLTFNI